MNALTIANVEAQIVEMAPQFAALLPPDVPADKFRSVALAAIRNNPALLQCEPHSLFNACLNAAQDGLLPDGREGAIVPRKGKAVWQAMIQGIYKRVKSSGSVAALSANVVYDGETFDVLLGDEDRIVHRRDMAKVARGQEVAVYAIATLKDGSKEREVMTWDQVEDVRKSSAMPNSGPWTMWADEMARKTVVRRLAKRLPVIDQADEALQRTIQRVDQLYDFGKPAPEAPTIEAEAPSPAPPDARDALNASVPLTKHVPLNRAAAAPMSRPPVVRAPAADDVNSPDFDLEMPDVRAHTHHGTVDVSGRWKAWEAKVAAALGQTQSRAEVEAIAGHPTVEEAYGKGPASVRRNLDQMLHEHVRRHAEIEAADEPAAVDDDPFAPGLEIAGEEKLAG